MLQPTSLVELAVLFFGGIGTGLFGSTVGSGSLLSVPLLIWVGFPMHVVIGTNRFSACVLELTSSVRFVRERVLNKRLLRLGAALGIAGAFGAVFGSRLVLSLDEDVVAATVAVFLILAAIVSLRKRSDPAGSPELSGARMALLLLFAALLGVYAGYFGAGAGTLLMLLLSAQGFSLLRSGAMSRVAGLLWSLSATAVFGLHGTIAYLPGVFLSAGLAVGGWIGAGLGVKKGDTYIRVLLISVLVATALKLAVQAVH